MTENTKQTKTYILEKLNEYKALLEQKGYDVVYVGLFGSQNYNMTDGESDVDARAIVMPTLEDLVFGKTTSKTIEVEDGLIDVKDVMTFAKIAHKGNSAFLEIIETEYYIGDTAFRDLFKDIKVKPMSLFGAAAEKLSNISRQKPGYHPTFETHHYDSKNLHHIIRLRHLIGNIKINGEYKSFEYLEGDFRDELLKIKRGEHNISYDEACRLGAKRVEEIKEIALSMPQYKINDDYTAVGNYMINRLNNTK